MNDVFFLGGDRYHQAEVAFAGVGKTLEEVGLQVEYTTDCTSLHPDALAGKKLLVILRDGMNWPKGYDQPHIKWMNDEQQQAIWDFVHNGGGVLPLHNAQGLYPEGGLYYKLFGGDYGGHPASAVYRVRVEDHNHPVTAGVEDYEIYDEQHMVKYYLDRDHELLRSISSASEEAAAGWWQDVGKGRMVYLSMGHTPEALHHPMTQRLLRNAVRWCTRMD